MNYKNGKIYFADGWHCTDPDNMQFGKQVGERTFLYIEAKNEEIKDKYHSLGKNALQALNGCTTSADWYIAEIDLDDYTPNEVAEYLSAYDGILDNVTDEVQRNQLIAECIFESIMLEL